MKRVPHDDDLNFLYQCTRDELAPLVGILLGTNDDGTINRDGRYSSELNLSDAFRAHYPDHTKYVYDIIAELQTFGGNTIANKIKGYGVPYKELLYDAAKKAKVNCNRKQETERLENELMDKMLADNWEKIPEDERNELLKDAGKVTGRFGGAAHGVALAIFRHGGFASYKLALKLTAAISKAILGHGFKLPVMAGVSRVLGVWSGPIGWVITEAWMTADITAPAFRVTIPACLYIAGLRQMKKNEKYALEMTEQTNEQTEGHA